MKKKELENLIKENFKDTALRIYELDNEDRKSLFITLTHSFLLANARSRFVTTNSSPLDKAFKAFWNSGFISASRLKSSENIKLQPSPFNNCICSSM